MSLTNGIFSLIIRAVISYAVGWALLLVFFGVFQAFMSEDTKKLMAEKGPQILKLCSLFSAVICFIISFIILPM